MLPTDKRLRSLSPFQLLWLAACVRRREGVEADAQRERLRLICTFINPRVAQDVFKETKETVSSGFEEDLKSLDPKIDIEKYKPLVE